MPLFTLSGTIISMGFIILMNIFALNYAMTRFYKQADIAPTVYVEEIAQSSIQSESSITLFHIDPSAILSLDSDSSDQSAGLFRPLVERITPLWTSLSDSTPDPIIAGFSHRGPPRV